MTAYPRPSPNCPTRCHSTTQTRFRYAIHTKRFNTHIHQNRHHEQSKSLTRFFNNLSACRYRIPGIATDTEASRRVVHNFTLRVQSASTRTRINAFVVHACLIPIAVRVLNALGATTRIRIAEVSRLTCTRAGAMQFSTYGVGSARRRYTGFGWRGWHDNWNY